jgi:type IV pilus assembly protein PilB
VSNSSCYSPESVTIPADRDNSIVHLVDRILAKAIEDGASHLYFEPQAKSLQIRVRQDGLLQTALQNLPQATIAPTIAYLKSSSGIKSADRTPQIGTIDRLEKCGRVRIEITTLPTPFGDTITATITYGDRAPFPLDRLIPQREVLDRVRQLIHSNRGLILVVGESDRDTSTTIAASLAELGRSDRCIYAIDRQQHYTVPGVNQIVLPVDADDTTVARTIRLCLRHQPDLMAIGEISSLEIAQAAIQAVAQGCLVFATISATTIGTALARTIDLGVSPGQLYSATIGIVTQTSIKHLCHECRLPVELNSLELARLGNPMLGLNQQNYYHANTLSRGEIESAKQLDRLCPKCHGGGYRGTISLYEVLPMFDRLKSTISGGDAEAIDLAVQETGMRSMLDLAIPLFREGKTTLAEIQNCLDPKLLLQHRLANVETYPDPDEIDPDDTNSLAAALHWKQQALKAKLECEQLLSELESYQQESDEYEQRIKQTRSQIEQSTRAEIALQLLSTIDVIELARTSIKPQTDREAAIQKGYSMLETKMLTSIKEIGVRVTESQGRKFDSHLHEVIQEIGTHDYPPGTIVSEYKRGYTLGDRILRLAQVKVAVASNF